MTFELKLASGQVVKWDGEDPVDAVLGYTGSHPGTTVIAWRHAKEIKP